MKKLLLILISISLLSCGHDEEMSKVELGKKINKIRARNRKFKIMETDTLTMPDGHIYFFSTGGYWASMCHAEGYCKNH